MEKAMTDVIIPALENGNHLAMEQAYFVLFHLRLIGSQFDKDLHFKLAELRAIAQCVQQLADAVGSVNPTAASRARELLASSAATRSLELPSRDAVIAQVTELKTAADGLLRQALAESDPALRRTVTRIALCYSERDIVRRRVWVKDAGYDLEAGDLPSLDEVLT
jgi:hypothetical protein